MHVFVSNEVIEERQPKELELLDCGKCAKLIQPGWTFSQRDERPPAAALQHCTENLAAFGAAARIVSNPPSSTSLPSQADDRSRDRCSTQLLHRDCPNEIFSNGRQLAEIIITINLSLTKQSFELKTFRKQSIKKRWKSIEMIPGSQNRGGVRGEPNLVRVPDRANDFGRSGGPARQRVP